MQRFSFVASVSDLGLFAGLATTRRRLAASAAIATAAVVVYGLLVADFVLYHSASVSLNLVLVSVQFFLVLGAAYVQAMWLGSRIFGDPWRRRVFLGERPGEDGDVDIAGLRDNSLHFYGLFGAAGVACYLAVSLATGDYVTRYNDEGYYLTLLRADGDSRVQAIRGLVDPVRDDAALRRPLREALAGALDDPDPEVRAWAAWACGHRQILEAAPALDRLVRSGGLEERIEAAIALGRLRDPAGERALLGLLAGAQGEPALARAIVTGLGLIPSADAVPALAGLLGAVDPEVEAAALWAIGRARTTSVRAEVLQRWQAAEDTATRCAAAEALKHVTTVEDYDAMRRAWSEDERVECPEVAFHGRQYDDEHPLPPVVYVVGEELRLKYVKAAFNIGGPGLEDWLTAIAWAEGESVAMRVEADRMVELLRRSPARLPRQ